MIQDETLDRLLLALTRSPTDQDLIRVIGDRLEEVGHPAAEWWSKQVNRAKFHDHWWFLRTKEGHMRSFAQPSLHLPELKGIEYLCGKLNKLCPPTGHERPCKL